MSNPPKLTALIDADIVTFRAASRNEKTYHFSEGDEGCQAIDPELALFDCRKHIEDIRVATGATDVLLCFSGRAVFRYDILSSYKHNRKGKRKPVLLGPLREALEAEYPSESHHRLEADDVLGIRQSTATPDNPTIICTIDKDLDQIAGDHYNWNKDKLYHISPEQGLYYTWLQVLTGDTTDGYHGIKGVGPKGAEKLLRPKRYDKMDMCLLDQAKLYDATCWQAYRKAGQSKTQYGQQIGVATILQGDDMFIGGRIHTRYLTV